MPRPCPSPPPPSESSLPSVRLLLGPGPSPVHPRVYRAMTTPLLGHLDPQFLVIMNEVQAQLRFVFQTANPFTIAVSGTGSAGMEAALVNVIEPGDTVDRLRRRRLRQPHGRHRRALRRQAGEARGPLGPGLPPRRHRGGPEEARPGEGGGHRPRRDLHRRPAADGRARQALPRPRRAARRRHRHLAGRRAGRRSTPGRPTPSTPARRSASPARPGWPRSPSRPRALDAVRARKTKVQSWYLDAGMVADYWAEGKRVYHHTAPITMVYALREALRLVLRGGARAPLRPPPPQRRGAHRRLRARWARSRSPPDGAAAPLAQRA